MSYVRGYAALDAEYKRLLLREITAMFKVGDRVRRLTTTNAVPAGTLGTVTAATPVPDECLVDWDNGCRHDHYNAISYKNISLVNSQVTPAFKVGDRVRITNHPAQAKSNVGELGTIIDKSGALFVKYDKLGEYPLRIEETWLEVVTAAQSPTYKPGDKIVATCEHGRNLNMPPNTAKVGDVGEYIHKDVWHVVKFNGVQYECDSDCFTHYTSTAPAQRPTLSCVRCGEPNQYAESNLGNGGYACYSCRKYHAYAIGGSQ